MIKKLTKAMNIVIEIEVFCAFVAGIVFIWLINFGSILSAILLTLFILLLPKIIIAPILEETNLWR